MTKEQAINGLKENLCSLCAYGSQNMDSCDIRECDNRDYINALGQQPSDDVMAIHTQGLDEGVRCAMCTNSMKSDRGCDGGCVVDEDMYKKVTDTIKNHIFNQLTSDDCVSRQAVDRLCFRYLKPNTDDNIAFYEHFCDLPPVTPAHCIVAVRFSKEDLREICNERIEIECTHGTCKDCKHWKDSDGVYRRGIDAESKCPINNSRVFEGTFYCADFEKRGNEE